MPTKPNKAEARHFDPDFHASDSKWLLFGRWHVQKVAPVVSLICCASSVLLALAGYILFFSNPVLIFWLGINLLLLTVSTLAFLGSIKKIPFLLLPFILVMWAFSVLWFGLFFFLLPMIVVPRFWNNWLDVLFGIGKPGKSAVRAITIGGALFSFIFLCVFTVLNVTMKRARNFMFAEQIAQAKEQMASHTRKTHGNDGRNSNTQVLETVA
ncbi:hypothetical protein ACQ4LE_001049 [Meloidogyne hapla]|uniref:MARVEL domain-containing protein n=1 Tax=Meloidogyne hapla TaxID=6305 RepID=A0A1I8AXP0_MELHA